MAYHKEYYVYVCRDKVIRVEFAPVSRGCSALNYIYWTLKKQQIASFEYSFNQTRLLNIYFLNYWYWLNILISVKLIEKKEALIFIDYNKRKLSLVYQLNKTLSLSLFNERKRLGKIDDLESIRLQLFCYCFSYFFAKFSMEKSRNNEVTSRSDGKATSSRRDALYLHGILHWLNSLFESLAACLLVCSTDPARFSHTQRELASSSLFLLFSLFFLYLVFIVHHFFLKQIIIM